MKKQLLALLVLFPTFIFAQANCNILPSSYKSYEIAVNKVKEAKFSVTDNISTSKSSWITSANYYSCDGKTGYLIIGLKSRIYIHQNLPIQIWRKFKSASSFGNYYNNNIRNHYQLHLSR